MVRKILIFEIRRLLPPEQIARIEEKIRRDAESGIVVIDPEIECFLAEVDDGKIMLYYPTDQSRADPSVLL